MNTIKKFSIAMSAMVLVFGGHLVAMQESIQEKRPFEDRSDEENFQFLDEVTKGNLNKIKRQISDYVKKGYIGKARDLIKAAENEYLRMDPGYGKRFSSQWAHPADLEKDKKIIDAFSKLHNAAQMGRLKFQD